jgi:hypothetical protein
MSRWINVQDAAIIAHRKPRTIYLWIDQGHLTPQLGDTGEILIDGQAVLIVEETRRRGRPRNAAKSANTAVD